MRKLWPCAVLMLLVAGVANAQARKDREPVRESKDIGQDRGRTGAVRVAREISEHADHENGWDHAEYAHDADEEEVGTLAIGTPPPLGMTIPPLPPGNGAWCVATAIHCPMPAGTPSGLACRCRTSPGSLGVTVH